MHNPTQKTTIGGKGRGGGSVPQKALAAVAGRVPCRGVKVSGYAEQICKGCAKGNEQLP